MGAQCVAPHGAVPDGHVPPLPPLLCPPLEPEEAVHKT
jgi:hypothetical protein